MNTALQISVPHEALADFQPDPQSDLSPLVQEALFLARRLQERATELQTAAETRQQAELDRMLRSPSDKATLAQMTDQAFRTSNPHRAVEHLIHILDVQGVPRFFSPLDRTLIRGFQSFGPFFPGVALPLVKEHMQKETANVILPGEKELLRAHLRERAGEGVRMNVNFLGEAILSEAEAERRLQHYLEGLQWPEIEVVSIKISTLDSRISPLARAHTVATLCARLEPLFLAADRARFTLPDGRTVPKFVYLDMEEYRDKDLTAAAFMRTLDRPALAHVRAGIALQSYLPDSFRTLLQLQYWARHRVAAGGGRITLRLVKGANLEMERVEASLHGWPQAPFKTKGATDANYKRMLHEMLQPENLAAIDVGVASHNLFDVAYAFVLARERNALDHVQFEMLEGMANPQRRALLEFSRNLLLYAPACRKENFINAIGYLIRRLDENTGPENFLRHAFNIRAGSPEWQKLEQSFLASFEAIPTLGDAPRRTQNRQLPPASPPAPLEWQHFQNEPDTDFALPQNSAWAEQVLARWQPRHGNNAVPIPLVIAGRESYSSSQPTSGSASNQAAQPPNWQPQPPLRTCLDPSRPGVVVGRYPEATEADTARAVECAAADPDGWRALPAGARFEWLGKVAQELRQARGELMGAALANGGKTLGESDPEVSEAVDFVEFYRATARWWQERPTLRARGKGVVVVVSPWNFPIAIPCGGVAAALAAGNNVLLKPASDTVLVAWELCQCFWRAGVPKTALQFLPCSGSRLGSGLVNHPKVDAVILTGGTQTARAMLRDNPSLNLFAETGGKDATIVTALSDRDQAIKHVLHSAFSHAGQKCSATSLLLLQDEVYDDPAFRRALCEAARSIQVGSAWQLETKMGPLIRPPSGDLDRALTTLEAGEEWALKPEPVGANPNLWTPGIKYGVRPGSYTHLTEFFGPVLAVMRFEELSEAVALVNQTGYGLTSGLESLDEREWDYWKEHLRAGNLYVNRVTTGAVVLRQPFGGLGQSAFGPGLKAGGPNYVAQFMDFTDVPTRNLGPIALEPEVVSNTGAEGKRGFFSPALSSRLAALAHRPRAGAEGGAPCVAGNPAAPAPSQWHRGEGEATETGAPPWQAPPILAALCQALCVQAHPDAARVIATVLSYERACREEFVREHDHFKLVGQDNVRRYLPLDTVRVRVHPEDTPFEVFARACAAHVVGCAVRISSPAGFVSSAIALLEQLAQSWAGTIDFVEETDEQLARCLRERQTDRVRYAACARVPRSVRAAAADSGICIVSVPVSSEGRLELLWYLREQSLSIDYHRYGNLGSRAAEPRAPVL